MRFPKKAQQLLEKGRVQIIFHGPDLQFRFP